MTTLESFEIHCKILFKLFAYRFPDFCNLYEIKRNQNRNDRLLIAVEAFGLRYRRANMSIPLEYFTDGWVYNVLEEFIDTMDRPHRFYDALGYSLTDEFKALFQLYLLTENVS